MTQNSKIEWCHHSFNPWIGCTKVGPGCDNCYAETQDNHRKWTPEGWGAGKPRKRTSQSNWELPLRWNRKAKKDGSHYRIFCASLADWLDNEVPIEWLADLLDAIRKTPELDWLLLSKRIGNFTSRINAVVDYLKNVNTGDTATALNVCGLLEWLSAWVNGSPPKNVWLGSTVVNQPEADRDILKLLKIPAYVHWLSMEPLLESVDLTTIPYRFNGFSGETVKTLNCLTGEITVTDKMFDNNPKPLEHIINWVVVGGESGSNARPMHPDWARSLRDQCVEAGVAFHFKQWGEFDLSYDRDRDDPDFRRCNEVNKKPGRWINLAGGHGFHGERVHYAHKVGKTQAGRTLDGRTWDQYPEAQS